MNVFVSAHLSETGAAAQILNAVSAGKLRLVASPELIEEVDEVLHRRGFRNSIPRERADQTIVDLRMAAEMHYPDDDPTPITRDAKDDYLVRLARTAKVDYLVSGDRDLLESGVDDVVIINTGVFAREVLPSV